MQRFYSWHPSRELSLQIEVSRDHGVLDYSLFRSSGFSPFPPLGLKIKPAFAGVAWEPPLSKYQLGCRRLAALKDLGAEAVCMALLVWTVTSRREHTFPRQMAFAKEENCWSPGESLGLGLGRRQVLEEGAFSWNRMSVPFDGIL